MSSTRREFLGRTAVLGGALGATSLGLRLNPARAAGKSAGVAKRILILGGTSVLGATIVGAALARGHKVSVFNRGKREKRIPFEFRDVEHLYGNRDPELPADDDRDKEGKLLHPDSNPKGLGALAGKKWVAVSDNSGSVPRRVSADWL